MMSFTSYWHFD